MKITFVLPYASTAGGVRVTAIYARKLTDMGHEVTVISRARENRSFTRQIARLIRKKRWFPRDKGKPPTTQLDFLGERHVILPADQPLRAQDLPDADALIATWWETAYDIAEMPPEKGKKFYFIQHHEVHEHLPKDRSAGSYRLPLKKITISGWLVEVMAELYGDSDVALVENSVDLEMFDAPPRGKAARPTVGLLYATGPFKGVDISLEAIKHARSKVPDLQVVAFGAKPPLARLPLPEGTRFHEAPPQNQIREVYAACDAWLFGSRNEGFGLPILEAMACRTPVIGTRTGAALDFLDGKTGHLVDIEDWEAMGDRLAEVLLLPEDQWKAMSDAAYARARGYSWDTAAAKFERVLQAECTKPA